MDDFPANSNKRKSEKPNIQNGPIGQNKEKPAKPEKNIQKVVTGKAIERKKTFGEKVHDVFIGGEIKTAGSYILAEVLLPALRAMIVEATSKGVERMIYGDTSPRRSSSSFGRTRIQYNNPVERFGAPPRAFLPGQSMAARPNRQSINDIVLASREDAEAVVEQLAIIVDQYDVASVADLKTLVDITPNWVDQNWGWDSVHYVDIRQTRDGWLVSFPEVVPIKA